MSVDLFRQTVEHSFQDGDVPTIQEFNALSTPGSPAEAPEKKLAETLTLLDEILPILSPEQFENVRCLFAKHKYQLQQTTDSTATVLALDDCYIKLTDLSSPEQLLVDDYSQMLDPSPLVRLRAYELERIAAISKNINITYRNTIFGVFDPAATDLGSILSQKSIEHHLLEHLGFIPTSLYPSLSQKNREDIYKMFTKHLVKLQRLDNSTVSIFPIGRAYILKNGNSTSLKQCLVTADHKIFLTYCSFNAKLAAINLRYASTLANELFSTESLQKGKFLGTMLPQQPLFKEMMLVNYFGDSMYRRIK